MASSRKRYKMYRSDSNIPIPLRTKQFWERKIRLRELQGLQGANASHSTSSTEPTDSQMDIEQERPGCDAHNTSDSSSSDASSDFTSSDASSDQEMYSGNASYDRSHSDHEEYYESTSDGSSDADSDSSLDSSYSEESLLEHEEFSDSSSESESVNLDPIGPEEDISSEREFITSGGELYSGAPITVGVSCMLIQMFAAKHNLTAAALEDLIRLVEAHCPEGNKCIASAYMLKKYFAEKLNKDPPPEEYFCCSCCQAPMTSSGERCNRNECRKENAKVVTFYHMDVEAQLKRFYKDKTFMKNLHTNHDGATDTISDIYDGRSYRSLTEPGGFMHLTNNITFSLNTDGVAIFKSTKAGQLWPVYLSINELAPNLRFSKKYLLLAGFWFAPAKPRMTTFLDPLMDRLNKILEHGVQVTYPDKTMHTVRGQLLLSSIDLQAKALLANHKQFNGEFGCNSCLDAGKRLRGPHRVWPYAGPIVLRTNTTYGEHVIRVMETEKPYKGVKGASVLYRHLPFDMGQGFPCDWMHSVLLGTMKTMLELWLGRKNSKKPFYVGDKILWMDEQVRNMRVPDNISHAPRKLSDRQHFKASEIRAFLLHYSLPVLREVLPEQYFAHYVLLVSGVSMLVSDNISEDQLSSAEQRLDVFCKEFEELYGESPQTMNVHLLRHLAHNTRLYGPLWAYSCFGYEAMNGHLKRMVHGTRFIVEQITCSVVIADNLQRLVDTLDPNREAPKAVRLARKLCITERRSNVTELSPGVDRIGKPTAFCPERIDMGDDIERAIKERMGDEIRRSSCEVFHRASLAGQNIYSRGYGRETARNNRTVEYMAQDSVQYGEVLMFCTVHDENLAVLKSLQPVDSPLVNLAEVNNPDVKGALTLELENFVIEVVETNMCIAVPIRFIRRKCVMMQTCKEGKKRTYIGRFPNIVEHD